MKHLFGTTHEDIWKQLFKAEKGWPAEIEDRCFSIVLLASEVIENSAEYIFLPCFNYKRS